MAESPATPKNKAEEKLRAVRALWLVAHNQTGELEPLAVEFFFAIGDLLEGELPEQLKTLHISKEAFLKELRAE